MLLTESITHLEDLDIKDFIRAVKNIANMQATEKLDGANLWFGLDNNGALYTTRAGKREGSERFYNEADYPYFAANNGFRATLAALKKKEVDIRKVLSAGDTVEIEVLFGRQPNAVTYGLGGKNFIAFLRGVEGTADNKIDALVNTLDNNEVTVHSQIVDTADGVELQRSAADLTFRFVGVQKINSDLLKSADVSSSVKELEDYLEKDSGVGELSNFELMTTSLGSISKDERPEAKEKKESVIASVKTKFKIRIKKELLDKFVSKIKPALAAGDLSGDEDNGIEGVVLRDPATGEQIKIVDKDGFTTINQFNFAVRNQITGMIRTTNDDASLESKGGIVGVMKIRIAEVLGNKEMAIGRSAKKIFTDNKGDTAQETLRNVAKILNGNDYIASKKKIQAVIVATMNELDSMLKTFNKTKDDIETYRLKLKSGKAMGLSPEIIKRTLMTFAETRRNLGELLIKVKGTKTFENLIAVLYGRAARNAHGGDDDDSVNESLDASELGILTEALRNYTDKARYTEIQNTFNLLSAYFATIMMAVLIYKANDKAGIRMLKDKPHYKMRKWAPEMSQVNFWGYVIWRSGTDTVQKLIGKKTALPLYKQVKKIPSNWVNFLHMDLSFARDVPIDWDEHMRTLAYLLQYPGVKTERLNNILLGAFAYDKLSYDEKVKLLPKLYFFAMQFVPTSPLIRRIRIIQDNLLLNPIGANDNMVVTESLLKRISEEDGDLGTTNGDSSPVIQPNQATSNATSSGDIASKEKIIGRGRRIVKRKRNPAVNKKRFERPKE